MGSRVTNQLRTSRGWIQSTTLKGQCIDSFSSCACQDPAGSNGAQELVLSNCVPAWRQDSPMRDCTALAGEPFYHGPRTADCYLPRCRWIVFYIGTVRDGDWVHRSPVQVACLYYATAPRIGRGMVGFSKVCWFNMYSIRYIYIYIYIYIYPRRSTSTDYPSRPAQQQTQWQAR
jgi:hypothetical protein